MGTYVAGDATSQTASASTLPGLTWPAHTASDLAVLGWAQVNTAAPSLDGTFTSQANVVDTNVRGIIASRVTTGSESGDVSLSSDTANRQAAAMALYRGYSGVAQVTNQPETNGTAQTVHSSPAITPGTTGAAVILVYLDRVSSGTTTITPPAGYTKRHEFGTSGSGGVFICLADKLTGTTAGVQETPGTWTASVASTSAIVFAVELTPTSTSVTGTAAVTQAAQTSTASGQLGYTGTVARTQAANTSTASGAVTGPVTGTAAVVQAGNTASASGKLGYTGSSAVVQAAQSSSAAGQLGYSGTASAVQVANTASASGTFTVAPVTGSAAVSQAEQTASAVGQYTYDRVTHRPNLGTTARPSTGTTARPSTGTTSRP